MVSLRKVNVPPLASATMRKGMVFEEPAMWANEQTGHIRFKMQKQRSSPCNAARRRVLMMLTWPNICSTPFVAIVEHKHVTSHHFDGSR